MEKTFYLTTPIFYANADLHMGHAYAFTLADIIARAKRLQGYDTFFLTGSDEHGEKVRESAQKAGMDPQMFVDLRAERAQELLRSFDISHNDFIRTTDTKRHVPGAVLMWQKLVEAGDIYKSNYVGLYCLGCEEFKQEKDLVDGKCPFHDQVPQRLAEENYFFKLSKYTDILKKKIESDELAIVPITRKNEILALFAEGLSDVSFSRPASKISWGIPVPGDPSQTIYVWCDALVNYLSAIGYGSDEERFAQWWPADLHILGKDILRFHAAIWPAMLLSAGLSLPRMILCHAFITSGGKKMSKTIGNVIDPHELIAEYGIDALRYYFAREISPFNDGDLTLEKFKEAYNDNLANGIGNLVSRIMKMATTYFDSADLAAGLPIGSPAAKSDSHYRFGDYEKAMNEFRVNDAANIAWDAITELDREIQETEPFKVFKTNPEKAREIVRGLVLGLSKIVPMLEPIIPSTAAKIRSAITTHTMPSPLFTRKS